MKTSAVQQSPAGRGGDESGPGRAPVPPLLEGVEDELGAAEGVFAPARDLIVHRQAQALLEVRAGVRDVAPYEPLHLQHARVSLQETTFD